MLLIKPDRFRLNFADAPLAEIEVSFNPQAEPTPEGLQLVEAEVPPLVIVVAEDTDVPEKYFSLRIVLGGVPRASACWIEKLRHDDRVGLIFLAADFGESSFELLGDEFHGFKNY